MKDVICICHSQALPCSESVMKPLIIPKPNGIAARNAVPTGAV
ncbi:hypothetical protein HMPREF0239_01776 [Clostridium sp. ATCC BAA-442]|nr:hypothetical protein HMPREF0239_01776 [Clostridium sp. ATCC BAA-442]